MNFIEAEIEFRNLSGGLPRESSESRGSNQDIDLSSRFQTR